VTARQDICTELKRLGALDDDAFDPAEAGLLLAKLERLRTPLESYRRHLARLAEEVGIYAGTEPDLELRAEALTQVIARRYGYAPADREEPEAEAINLMEAIDQRQGSSAALAMVYLHVVRALGWPAIALDFPARVYLRLEDGGRRLIIDPYDGGRIVRPEDMRALLKAESGAAAELNFAHHRPLTGRALLLRLHTKVKVRMLRAERLEEAVAAVEAMLLLAPDATTLWREAGLLHARLDHVKSAVSALEEYMRRTGAGQTRYSTSVLLQQLRGRLS
jgi:regulator of sirC expression with transglutaminase-like and TPR domain